MTFHYIKHKKSFFSLSLCFSYIFVYLCFSICLRHLFRYKCINGNQNKPSRADFGACNINNSKVYTQTHLTHTHSSHTLTADCRVSLGTRISCCSTSRSWNTLKTCYLFVNLSFALFVFRTSLLLDEISRHLTY